MDHLQAARECIAIAESGDSKRQAYERAAEHVAAAIDEGMTQAHVATGIGKSRTEVQRLLRWRESGYEAATPWLSDGEATTRAAKSHTKKFLAEQPLEQVEQLIAGLPRDRQEAIGAAAGNTYLQARQDYREEKERMTPAERKEREAAGDAIIRPVREAAGGFASLGIAAHIEQATDDLRELVSDASLTREHITAIEEALDAFITEFQVARGMVGLDEYERSAT